MAYGFKSGGREKGASNKDKKHFLETIQEKYPNYHPVVAMAEIANDLTNDVVLRFHANKEVAKFTTPTLRAVEYVLSKHEQNTNLPEWLNSGDTMPVTGFFQQGSNKQIDLSIYTTEELETLTRLLSKGGNKNT